MLKPSQRRRARAILSSCEEYEASKRAVVKSAPNPLWAYAKVILLIAAIAAVAILIANTVPEVAQ